MATRIYLVKQIINRDEVKRRLVRASTPASAIRHCADNQFSANVATQDELISLRDVSVENAGAENA